MSTSPDGLAGVRGVLRRFTTPLLPDDYTSLVNPLWSKRELRGKIESVERFPDDTIHLVIRPGWGVPVHFEAGQYIGIGLRVGGRFTWRSYSLTNSPETRDGLFAITVRAVAKGKLSNHLVGTARPGINVRLAAPAGDFHLTDPMPPKLLFVTAGSGVTPVIAMLRSLESKRQAVDIAVVHSVRKREDLIFEEVLKDYDAHIQVTSEDGRVSPTVLEELVPDFADRVVYACGPATMLDELETWADENGVEIRVERFTLDRASDAKGGTITFGNRGVSVEADGATTILEAGEEAGVQMPFGCRMGICQTCVRELSDGFVLDLRTGQTHEPGTRIRTCVGVAAGDITIDV
ncbi:ferredoxin reductase [Corynebacterium testudinoris]|uniref:Flavodoxin reductase family protein n=1 Tax=Corynebacterium testudinoris TaxID=136857 RepID=A0A0G3H8C2_9CORY|nr:ferredoxin reductase [Corynebacterium testudinoris]AKK08093.1 flavodoxin reductase family protein [Corynebacterium testudinoris]MBX8996652.1 ferredoxin reductase [Corynebacterium testudinoris]